MKKTFSLIVAAMCLLTAQAQGLTADQIVQKADANSRGTTLYSEVTMTIVRPTWQREISMKMWSKGGDYALVYVTAPAKDKGQAFLKRGKDLWNWLPSIGRTVKMSSSVMGQSWMGSDFTNDDMVKESSNVNDHTHTLLGSESVDNQDCYKILLTPKPNAAVVWGKVIAWITKKDFVEVKIEFYDDDGSLVHTYFGKNIKTFGSHKIATQLEVVPADKPNQKTVMTMQNCVFDKPINDNFFSLQNLTKVK